MATILIPIENVENPTIVRITTAVPDLTTGETSPASVEFYADLILLNVSEGDGTLRRYRCRSFIPALPLVLRRYDEFDALFDVAVTMSIAGSSDQDDESNLVSIDSVAVSRELTQFASTGQEENVLVLDFEIALLNATLLRASYTATVASSAKLLGGLDVETGKAPNDA
ncbi:hypothetical protein GJW-30_1_01626 [Variibacter gotjawalensis]|uniref:Uncharacterized protein n=1 Tax=Variibacter gotjawalensis TaxID=1333996 RepID=A0A0S3PT44_9BRAD|nr:hypothetical protein [Variibacter gotjawalensis]NIK49412.1 hypothetical protein [Variibacter gotjawalensis]RZS51264.1 hypothetical protein EV661_3741 [Variibacter gotjawalensis]BAT59097.1 hypothetical protein GJW-30_1_01626 [Variibacter gotjawalensis]